MPSGRLQRKRRQSRSPRRLQRRHGCRPGLLLRLLPRKRHRRRLTRTFALQRRHKIRGRAAAQTTAGAPAVQRELRPIPDVAPEFPEPNLNGRWAEFHDFRRLEPGREGRISLEPRLLRWRRGDCSADREPEHRSSFLTIAVPGIAAILAVGALLWSGSLRDRVLRQDAQMTALQEQNRKLADALAQMNVDQKVVGALNASGSAPTAAPDQMTSNSTNQAAGEAKAPASSGNDNDQAANANGGAAAPSPNSTAPPRQVTSSVGKREGVSVPPSLQIVGAAEEVGTRRWTRGTARRSSRPIRPSPRRRALRSEHPVHHPRAADGSSRPRRSIHPPARPASSTVPMTAQHLAAPAQPPASGANPAPSYGVGSSPAHSATGNGVYTSALAQNIEAVEGLQRQSQVPLREFHARDGMQTKVTPGLFVSVRSPTRHMARMLWW